MRPPERWQNFESSRPKHPLPKFKDSDIVGSKINLHGHCFNLSETPFKINTRILNWWWSILETTHSRWLHRFNSRTYLTYFYGYKVAPTRSHQHPESVVRRSSVFTHTISSSASNGHVIIFPVTDTDLIWLMITEISASCNSISVIRKMPSFKTLLNCLWDYFLRMD